MTTPSVPWYIDTGRFFIRANVRMEGTMDGDSYDEAEGDFGFVATINTPGSVETFLAPFSFVGVVAAEELERVRHINRRRRRHGRRSIRVANDTNNAGAVTAGITPAFTPP